MGFIDTWRGRVITLADAGFWRGFFGGDTTSGEVVNFDKALSLDAVWACINLKADTCSTLPCMVYEGDQGKVAKDHILYELLHEQPNLDDTAPEFWWMCVLSLMLDGNFFAEKKMSGERLVLLQPLHPLSVKVKRDNRNVRFYEVTEDGKVRKVAANRMFHVRGPVVPGCDRGLSPIGVLRNTIGNALAAEKTAGRFFANGLQTSGSLSSDGVLKPDQRTQIRDMISQFSGSDKAGKILVLEAGLKFQSLSINPEDAQMLETRQFSVEQICRIFGIPPVMIGHAANGTTTWGSGIEQLILQFVKSSLRPTLKRIEAAIRRDLMTIEERKTLTVKFNLEGLLRGDSAARAAFYSTMVQNGIYDRNFVRGLENQPPRPEANALTAQTNLAPLGMLGMSNGGTGVDAALNAMIQTAVEQAMAADRQQR